MYHQSIKSVKHKAAMSVNRSILKKSRHIGIGFLQFNPSTVAVLKETISREAEVFFNLLAVHSERFFYICSVHKLLPTREPNFLDANLPFRIRKYGLG